MSCFGISMDASAEEYHSPPFLLSKQWLIGVLAPEGQRNDQTQQTYRRHNSKNARTPNFSFKIGRRKRPTFAELRNAGGESTAVPRNCVGNNIGRV